MCGPHFPVTPKLGEGRCSMKITEDVRKYAAEHAIDESAAIEHGTQQKAVEFQHSGAEIYSKPR
jgi:phosphomethylpyrimidine synthase